MLPSLAVPPALALPLALAAFAARICVAAVLATAVVAKAHRPAATRAFAASLVALTLVPRRWSTAAALGVVGVEAATVALLVAPGTALAGATRAGAALAAVLLAGFTAALLVARHRGATAPCACFGAARTTPGAGLAGPTTPRAGLAGTTLGADLARNGVLVALAVVGLLPGAVRLDDPGLVPAAGCGLLGAVLIRHAADLVALARPRTVHRLSERS